MVLTLILGRSAAPRVVQPFGAAARRRQARVLMIEDHGVASAYRYTKLPLAPHLAWRCAASVACPWYEQGLGGALFELARFLAVPVLAGLRSELGRGDTLQVPRSLIAAFDESNPANSSGQDHGCS